jgi:hypothetical protein
MRAEELAIAPGAPTNPRAAAEHSETKAVRATNLIDEYLIDFFTPDLSAQGRVILRNSSQSEYQALSPGLL